MSQKKVESKTMCAGRRLTSCPFREITSSPTWMRLHRLALLPRLLLSSESVCVVANTTFLFSFVCLIAPCMQALGTRRRRPTKICHLYFIGVCEHNTNIPDPVHQCASRCCHRCSRCHHRSLTLRLASRPGTSRAPYQEQGLTWVEEEAQARIEQAIVPARGRWRCLCIDWGGG